MRLPTLPLLLCLLALPLVPAAGAGSVEGAGVVDATCGGPIAGKAPVRVHLARTNAIPFAGWIALVEAEGAPCLGVVENECLGSGSLSTGISFGSCLFPASGALGPIAVCAPGPASTSLPQDATAAFSFQQGLLTLQGRLDVVVSGDAVDEANVCA